MNFSASPRGLPLYVADPLACVPSLFRLVCLAKLAVSILFVLPFLTSVKWLPVCYDCKGSNDFDIVKNLFFFFSFCFALCPEFVCRFR